MRKDMKHKLVDTRRSGSGRNSKNMRYRRERLVLDEYEDEDGNLITDISDSNLSAKKTGIRDQSWERKQFGENLAPLARFVESKVGKNWDKVYSEICEFCDKSGAVSGHIFEHLWDWVIPAKRVFFKDGKPWENSSWGGPRKIETYRFNQFYVCPKDGTLKRAPTTSVKPSWKEREETKRNSSLKSLSDNKYLSKDSSSGLWYVIELKEQEYKTRTITWPSGEVFREDVGVYSEVSYPKGIMLPKKSGMIVIYCKSASKKDLKVLD